MYDLPELARSVYYRRFIELRIYPGDSGNVNNAPPTDTLPNTGADEYRSKPVGFDEKIDPFKTEKRDEVIDKSRAGREGEVEDRADDYYRNEVRHI